MLDAVAAPPPMERALAIWVIGGDVRDGAEVEDDVLGVP